MNKAFFIGRLGKDAIVKTVGDGKKVIDFTLAVDSGYGDKKTTLWLDCGKWGDNTKVSEYMTKGKQVAVVGEIGLRTWESESSGKTGATITLRVDQIELIGSKSDTPAGSSAPPGDKKTTTAAPNASDITEPVDDLPF